MAQMLKSYRVVGKKFAELREERGFTQDSLARTTGRSKGTFSRYEGEDAAGISPAVLDDLVAAYQMTRDEILARIGIDGDSVPLVNLDAINLEVVPDDQLAQLANRVKLEAAKRNGQPMRIPHDASEELDPAAAKSLEKHFAGGVKRRALREAAKESTAPPVPKPKLITSTKGRDMPQTGDKCTTPGIYKSSGCAHNVERTIPKDHEFPPCAHCHQRVTWILVRATQTK